MLYRSDTHEKRVERVVELNSAVWHLRRARGHAPRRVERRDRAAAQCWIDGMPERFLTQITGLDVEELRERIAAIVVAEVRADDADAEMSAYRA